MMSPLNSTIQGGKCQISSNAMSISLKLLEIFASQIRKSCIMHTPCNANTDRAEWEIDLDNNGVTECLMAKGHRTMSIQ